MFEMILPLTGAAILHLAFAVLGSRSERAHKIWCSQHKIFHGQRTILND